MACPGPPPREMFIQILRETLATGEQSIGQAEAVKETPKDRPRAPNLVLNAAQAQKEVAKPAVKDGKIRVRSIVESSKSRY